MFNEWRNGLCWYSTQFTLLSITLILVDLCPYCEGQLGQSVSNRKALIFHLLFLWCVSVSGVCLELQPFLVVWRAFSRDAWILTRPQGNFALISSLKNQADKTESFIAPDPVLIHSLRNSQVLWPAAQEAPSVEIKPGAPCLREHQNTPTAPPSLRLRNINMRQPRRRQACSGRQYCSATRGDRGGKRRQMY